MNETPTLQDQLILYVFNELPEAGVAAFEHHLISDPQLQEDHRVLTWITELLRHEASPFSGPSSKPELSPAALARLDALLAGTD